MKAEPINNVKLTSYLAESDGVIRTLIALEVLYRSGKDLQETMRRIFAETWIYKIIVAFMTYGPMHKAELCLRLFPDQKDKHYMLSRSNQVFSAFNYLVDNRIIVLVDDFKHKKVYDISPEYKPILRATLKGEILAVL